MMRNKMCYLMCIVSVLALSGFASAVSNEWKGAVSDDWADGANWSTGVVPGLVGQQVNIGAGAIGNPWPIIGTGDVAVAHNIFLSLYGALTVDGGSLTFGPDRLFLGYGSVGNLTVNAGVVNGTSIDLNSYAGIGTFLVTGGTVNLDYAMTWGNNASFTMTGGTVMALGRAIDWGTTPSSVNIDLSGDAVLGLSYYNGLANVQGWIDDGIITATGGIILMTQADVEAPIMLSVVPEIAYVGIDDFEAYDGSGNLITASWPSEADDWTSGSTVSLSLDSMHGGAQAMQLGYDNETEWYNYFSETTRTINADFTVNDVKAMDIWVKGDAANAVDEVYVRLNDGTSSETVYLQTFNGTAIDIQSAHWQTARVDLTALGLTLDNIVTITIGVGDADSPVATGTGTIYVDDIALYSSRCLYGLPGGDSNADCEVNFLDLTDEADNWLNSGMWP